MSDAPSDKSRLLVAVGASALLLVGAAAAAFVALQPEPEDDDTIADRFPPLAEGEEAILFAGDLLLPKEAWSRMEEHGNDWMYRKIQPVIDSANARYFIGNQEGPITKRRAKGEPRGKWMYRQKPETVPVLKDAGFTHLSLANNHALDRKRSGMLDTVEHLSKAGIQTFGGGADLATATKPVVLEIGGVTVGILAGMEPWKRFREHQWDAAADRAGVLLLRKEELATYTKAAREQVDILIAYPHWGANYAPVNKSQRRIADRFVAAGVDAIVGHHSHAAQGFGTVDSVPVLWSLGNTAFGTAGRFGHDKHQPGYGLLGRLVIAGGAIDRFEILPLRINNRLNNWQPRPMPVSEAHRKLKEFAKDEGGKITLERGVATMKVAPRKSASR
jgi:poly-gamma-glutamate capsule biosynthesis protein CapA/YwtB (metallophosphatase superfamily)